MTVTDERLGRVVRWTAILVAAWTVPVVIGVAGHYFGTMREPRGFGMPASHIFGHSFAMWYAWIPVTPLIFRAYRRLPFTRANPAPAAAAHLGLAVGVFLLQTWLTLVVGHATGHVAPDITFAMQFIALVENLLLYDLFIYAGVLAVAFGLDYARRYRDRDLRASQLETQLERARLVALQSQLQPHFLFNALNSIAMLVRRDRKQEALDVVVGFGELLRYVLDEAGTIDVPLEEEMRFVRRYLEIEQVRHRDRLAVEYAIAPEAGDAIVPNLLLQPLVENALKHGISHLPDGGRVRIAVDRVGAKLRLSVENDGQALPAGFSIDATGGVGLRNLRDRLATLVGDGARVGVAARPEGSGVCVTVELPYRTADDIRVATRDIVPPAVSRDMLPRPAAGRAG